MIDTANLTDEQFQTRALEVIMREFGLDGAARYIRLNLSGDGDYTRDRHLWLGEQTAEVEAEQQEHRAA